MSRYSEGLLSIEDGKCELSWGYDAHLGYFIDLYDEEDEPVFDICSKFALKPHGEIKPSVGNRYTKNQLIQVFEIFKDFIPEGHINSVALDLPF